MESVTIQGAGRGGVSQAEPFDPPITKGLQESIHEFRNIDDQIELKPILDHLAALPPLDLIYSSETEDRLPEIAGGISFALARSFKIIDPELKNPQTEHWERSQRIFDLLLLQTVGVIRTLCQSKIDSRQGNRCGAHRFSVTISGSQE